MILRSKHIILEHGELDGYLELENGVIKGLYSHYDGPCRDFTDQVIFPGFIDIHIHGWATGSFWFEKTAESIREMSRTLPMAGVTSYLATSGADSIPEIQRCIAAADQAWEEDYPGAQMMGIHLEGPFLASQFKGAMPEHLLKKGSLALLTSYQDKAEGNVRYITVSPEVEGVLEMIPALKELGITVAIGHSGADYDTAMAAIRAGAAACTHTFNAMALLHQHRPAILGAALESDIYCEMICDGLHLHPGIVRLLWKTKGGGRLVAITDSIMAAGLPDGYYHLGVNQVVVENGDAKLVSDGTRAGSTLTQDRALRNILAFTGLHLEDVFPVLTENPAKLIGVYDRKGSIEDGKDADLVVLDDHAQITEVFLRGRRLLLNT